MTFSFAEVGFGLALTMFGFIVYIFIPGSLIKGDMGTFFFILNMILLSIALGLTFVCTLIYPFAQKLVLWTLSLLCCSRKCLSDLARQRLESSRDRNTKISIMITGAISFLMFQAGGYLTINSISKQLYDFIIAGDITI